VLDGLAEESSSDAVISAEPRLAKALAGDALDAALEAVADFGDLKSPWFTGHSRGVARLAAAAAQEAGLPADALTELRRAALVHDLGRTGVPNTIWDKPGPLTDAERERVRLHPYYTERMLARPEALAGLGPSRPATTSAWTARAITARCRGPSCRPPHGSWRRRTPTTR
jgi:HD-GYP domain-containing protein (c-di-GMP phosphodiesterase class II)